MDRYDKHNAVMASVVFGLFGWLCVYMTAYSDHPKACFCMGLICFAVASFILGYVNGRR